MSNASPETPAKPEVAAQEGQDAVAARAKKAGLPLPVVLAVFAILLAGIGYYYYSFWMRETPPTVISHKGEKAPPKKGPNPKGQGNSSANAPKADS